MLGDSKSLTGILIRMVGGLFLAFTVIGPFADLNFEGILSDFEEFAVSGDYAAAAGTELAQQTMDEFIKQKTGAYILDKAADFGAELEVCVGLCAAEPVVPDSVEIRGSISPYAKNCIQRIIAEELGIPKENQRWIG